MVEIDRCRHVMKSKCNDELSYLCLCSMSPRRDRHVRQARRDRGELVVGSTGKVLGRGMCPRGYISATRVGGHCHGKHCAHDQQLDHNVYDLLHYFQAQQDLA